MKNHELKNIFLYILKNNNITFWSFAFTSRPERLYPRSSEPPLWGIRYGYLTKFVGITWYSPLLDWCIMPQPFSNINLKQNVYSYWLNIGNYDSDVFNHRNNLKKENNLLRSHNLCIRIIQRLSPMWQVPSHSRDSK
jgi:hypothetical protein